MVIYIPSVDGYIIDNPNIEFQRCDGKIYAYDEVNVANFTDTANSLIINGGQRRSPLSYVDTDRNTEISFTSSLFTLEMFEMANAENIETGDFSTLETKRFEWESQSAASITVRDYTDDPMSIRTHTVTNLGDCKLVIPYAVQLESIVVKNTNSEGKQAVLSPLVKVYKVGNYYYSYLPSTANEIYTEIYFRTVTGTLAPAQAGDTAKVSGKRRIVNGDRVTTKTNSTTAKGAFWIHWPVYSSGADCTQSNQKGILHLWMPRCRITQTPGLDGSYKTAQAPGITAAAIDPKRPDKKLFVLAYESLTEEVTP